MIREMILPQLAMGMSEGSVVEWMAKEGARIERDQPLVAIETEKVVTDLPAPHGGFLHILVTGGEKIPVETLIARIADTEDEYRQIVGAGAREPMVMVAPEAVPAPHDVGSEPARGPGGVVAGRIRASGLAKKIARQGGISLSTISGTGPGGRIVRRDVLTAIEGTQKRDAAVVHGAVMSMKGMREKARIPLTGMRATIAERMVKAKNTAAHTYIFFEIDVTKLVSVRDNLLGREQELGTRVSLTAIYARAVALACQHVPICNATLADHEITIWDNVNVGIAVALPGRGEYDSGLMVPVVRNVETKGLLAIDREIKDLVHRARSGALTPEDMADGTITISSTGGFMPGAWMVSTPLLNLPQVVNFQPGSQLQKPIVIDGKVEVRTILPCGLSFDHRAMDGEPAARFARKVSDLLGNPELMLL